MHEPETFAQIFDVAPVALLVVNGRGRIALMNEQAQRLFGYASEEIVDGPVEMLIAGHLRGAHMQHVRAFFANPVPRAMGEGQDLLGVDKGGREFPIEVGLTPMAVRGETLVLASIVDITRRVSLEARFRSAVEAAPIAMIIVDAARKIVDVNQEACRLFRYDKRELVGRDVEMLLPEEARVHHPTLVKQYLEEATPRRMGQGRRLFGVDKHGQRIPIEVGLSPVHTDDGVFVVTSVIDITRQLRDEKRFRDAVEAAPNAMLIVDETGVITLVNEQCGILFQYAKSEMVGQPVTMLIPEALREVHGRHVDGFIRNPEPRAMGGDRDLYGQRKDGTLFPVEVGLRPMVSETGISVISAIVDISERIAARKMLVDRNEELQQFAYRASHDLRSPLLSIGGVAEILGRRVGRDGDPQLLAGLSRISALANKLRSFVDDILTLTRADSIEESDEPYEIAPAIVSICDKLQHLIDEAGVRVETQWNHGAELHASAVRMTQVLENLISNAIRYANPDPRDRWVRVTTFNDASWFLINVADNGLGIEAEQHAAVFQMFRRFHAESTEGSGLGLYLVRKHVESLNGEISFSSAVGKGTTFYLKFPLR